MSEFFLQTGMTEKKKWYKGYEFKYILKDRKYGGLSSHHGSF